MQLSSPKCSSSISGETAWKGLKREKLEHSEKPSKLRWFAFLGHQTGDTRVLRLARLVARSHPQNYDGQQQTGILGFLLDGILAAAICRV